MAKVVHGEFCIECMMTLIKIVLIGKVEHFGWLIMDIEATIICISVSLIEPQLAMLIKHLILILLSIDGISLL